MADACDRAHGRGSRLPRVGGPRGSRLPRVGGPLSGLSGRPAPVAAPPTTRARTPHQRRCAPEVSVPVNESTPAAQTGLENLLHETRSFPPSPEFAAQANARPELYE